MNVDGQEEEDYQNYIIIESSEGQIVNILFLEDVRSEQVLYQCQFCEDLIELEYILNYFKTYKMEYFFFCEICGVVFFIKEKFKNYIYEKLAIVKSNLEMCDMCQQIFFFSDELL